MPSASRPRRPLAIVLAASTVSLSLFLAGCEGDEASRADKRISQKLQSAYTTDNPIESLKEAAGEDDASGASRARAQAMLADAELIAANDKMRQVEQNENRVATLVWELNALGQAIQTTSRLVDAYRSYDPAVVQQAAQAKVAEAQGDKLSLELRGQQVTFPGLKAVQQNVATLNEQIATQKGELARLTEQRNQLVQQAEQTAGQAETAKGRESVDAYTKASNLRKEASLLSSQIDTANAALTRLQSDLATQQAHQQILANLVKEYQQGAAATEKGFKTVAAQEEPQLRLIKEIYGTAGGNAAATNPASSPATILSRAAELAALVNETQELRAEATASLESAIQHYTAAQQSAEDHRRKIDEKMSTAASDAPERTAWEDMKALVNPSAYQLQKCLALQTLGSLYAAQADSLAARIRLADTLGKTLQAANLKLPESLAVKDGPAQLKELVEKTNATYNDASELESTVLDAPLATESQKSAARVAKILTLYAWGNAQAAAGNTNEAKKLRAESLEMVKGAVADNVTLPALPPEIAPAPKIVSTTPTTAPAATPPAAATPAAETPAAETPAPQ
jgi:hypothetical protein